MQLAYTEGLRDVPANFKHDKYSVRTKIFDRGYDHEISISVRETYPGEENVSIFDNCPDKNLTAFKNARRTIRTECRIILSPDGTPRAMYGFSVDAFIVAVPGDIDLQCQVNSVLEKVILQIFRNRPEVTRHALILLADQWSRTLGRLKERWDAAPSSTFPPREFQEAVLGWKKAPDGKGDRFLNPVLCAPTTRKGQFYRFGVIRQGDGAYRSVGQRTQSKPVQEVIVELPDLSGHQKLAVLSEFRRNPSSEAADAFNFYRKDVGHIYAIPPRLNGAAFMDWGVLNFCENDSVEKMFIHKHMVKFGNEDGAVSLDRNKKTIVIQNGKFGFGDVCLDKCLARLINFCIEIDFIPPITWISKRAAPIDAKHPVLIRTRRVIPPSHVPFVNTILGAPYRKARLKCNQAVAERIATLFPREN